MNKIIQQLIWFIAHYAEARRYGNRRESPKIAWHFRWKMPPKETEERRLEAVRRLDISTRFRLTKRFKQ